MLLNRILLENYKYVKAIDQRFQIEIIIRAILEKLKDSETVVINTNELPGNIKFGNLKNVQFNCECSEGIKNTYALYNDKEADFDARGNVSRIKINIHIAKKDYDNPEFNIQNAIRTFIYHELNHFYDDLSERVSKRRSVFKTLQGDKASIKYDKIVKGFNAITLEVGKWKVPQLIYYLLIKTEFDAYITQAYADCYEHNIHSIDEFKKTGTYELYQNLRETYNEVLNHYSHDIVDGMQYFSQQFLINKKIQNPGAFKTWYITQISQRLKEFEERILEIANFYCQTATDVDALNKKIDDYYESLKKLKESKGLYTMRKIIAKVPVYEKQHTSRTVYEIVIDEALIPVLKDNVEIL